MKMTYSAVLVCSVLCGCSGYAGKDNVDIRIVESADNCTSLGAVKGNNVLTSSGGQFTVADPIRQAKDSARKLGANAIKIDEIVSVRAGSAVTAEALQCPE